MATLVSVVIHLLVLSWLKRPTADRPTDVTLQVTLNANTPLEKTELSSARITNPLEPVTPALPTSVQSPPKDSVAEPSTTENSTTAPRAIPIAEMIRAFMTSSVPNTRQAPGEPCDLSDRASRIRLCDDGQHHTQTPADSRFEEAFDISFRPASEYFSDTASIDRMMKKQKVLTQLIADGQADSADLVKMRQELRDEINFIDRKYAEGNLFKVVDVSAKVTKALWDKARKD